MMRSCYNNFFTFVFFRPRHRHHFSYPGLYKRFLLKRIFQYPVSCHKTALMLKQFIILRFDNYFPAIVNNPFFVFFCKNGKPVIKVINIIIQKRDDSFSFFINTSVFTILFYWAEAFKKGVRIFINKRYDCFSSYIYKTNIAVLFNISKTRMKK